MSTYITLLASIFTYGRMLHNITRMLQFNLSRCIRKASQQFCNKPLLLNSHRVYHSACTLATPGHFYFSMIKHQLLVLHRNSSDDSTSDNNGIADSNPRNELSKDSSELVDFDEMLENIRKLRTQEDGDIKNIYTGKKKYRISDEERRTQPMSIEELVDFLTLLNGVDICVIHVDPSLNYVTYLVTVTGVSTRHLLSMAKSLVYEVNRNYLYIYLQIIYIV